MELRFTCTRVVWCGVVRVTARVAFGAERVLGSLFVAVNMSVRILLHLHLHGAVVSFTHRNAEYY